METKSIVIINGISIFSIEEKEKTLIPIRPICKLLGIDYSAQVAKLKSDQRFAPTVVLSTTVDANNNPREMLCMPVPFILLWLGNINPANVSEAARPALLRYSVECAEALFNHFAGLSRRIVEENKAEISLLEDIARLCDQSSAIKMQIKEKKDSLAKLRASRLDDQPTLF